MNGNVQLLKRQHRRFFIFLAILFLGSSLAFKSIASTTPAYEISEGEVSNAPSVRDLIDDYLNSKGWTEGDNEKNGKKFFVAVGVGTIAARRDSNMYISSRSNAYQKAFISAQRDMVQFLESEINAYFESSYAEPSEAREKARIEELTKQGIVLQAAKAQAAALSADIQELAENRTQVTAAIQAERLLKLEIDKRLIDAGFDPNQPVESQELKKILSTEGFKDATKIVANSRVAGMQAFKTFEVLPEGNQGTIGVVAIYSDRLHNLANALFSGKELLIPEGTPRKPLKEQIPQNESVLIGTFGVTAKVDEHGQLSLVSYGQAGARSNSSRSLDAAERKARLAAFQQIRFFAGAMVKTLESAEKSENLTELQNEIVAVTDDSYEESINVTAEALKISGLKTIKRWHSKHPLTGHYIAGQVVVWQPQSSTLAKDIKTNANDIPSKNQGFQQNSQPNKVNLSGGKTGTFISGGAEGSQDF